MKIKEHDCVVLTADLPDEKLKSGDVGTVVHVHKGGAAYEVEFMTLDGHTVAVVNRCEQSASPCLAPRHLACARAAGGLNKRKRRKHATAAVWRRATELPGQVRAQTEFWNEERAKRSFEDNGVPKYNLGTREWGEAGREFAVEGGNIVYKGL